METQKFLAKRDGRFVWSGGFSTKDIPKSAGFRWDPLTKLWWTDDISKAARLAAHADETASVDLAPVAEAHSAKLDASRALTSSDVIPVPDGLEYYGYQKAGITYAAQQDATLIADEMGLGKTIQVVGVINAREDIKRVLIVCPATLRINWKRELERWLVRPMNVGIATTKDWPDTDVVIVNYDIAWRKGVVEHLHAGPWDLVTLDEAHKAKNPDAKRTVSLFGKKDGSTDGVTGRVKIVLTGTPIPTRPVEMFPARKGLDPKAFRFWPFVRRFCNASKGSYGWDFSGAAKLDELQDLLRSTVMVRRLKNEAVDLPPKVRQVIEVTDEGILRRERAAMKQAGRAYAEFVAAMDRGDKVEFTGLAKARAELARDKAPHVVEHVAEMLQDGVEKVVVFAHHHDVVDCLVSGLSAYHPRTITGRDSATDRVAAEDAFQNGDECRVIVCSTLAAGVGLTLTRSSHVVFAELDWVPANVVQAEDRCHRIGTTETVFVHHLVVDGTLDAHLAKTLLRKQAIADKALDTDSVLPWQQPVVAEPVAPPRATATPRSYTFTLKEATFIQDALRHIAGMCDGARERDDSGFNGLDTKFGKSLAASPKRLSDKQATYGLKMLKKYQKRQMTDAMRDGLDAIRERRLK